VLINDGSGSSGAALSALSVDLDLVSASLDRLAKDLELLPHGAEVDYHRGPVVGSAAVFNDALGVATRKASVAAGEMRAHLVDADAAIRAAVTALTAQDEDAQQYADNVLDALDNNAELAPEASAAPATEGSIAEDTTASDSTELR
jgi:hypothetical protein